jgi:hypothetical protein
VIHISSLSYITISEPGRVMEDPGRLAHQWLASLFAARRVVECSVADPGPYHEPGRQRLLWAG